MAESCALRDEHTYTQVHILKESVRSTAFGRQALTATNVYFLNAIIIILLLARTTC